MAGGVVMDAWVEVPINEASNRPSSIPTTKAINLVVMILGPHGRRRHDGRLGGSASQRTRRAGLAEVEERMALKLVVMRSSSMVGVVMDAWVE